MSDNQSDQKDKAPATAGGMKPTETGAAKAAKAQAAEVQGVVQTDPTDDSARQNVGVVPAVQTAGVGDQAVLLRLDDEVDEALLEATGGEEFVTLQKDVVEEFVYPGTVRPAHRLLYGKGQVVPRSTVDALNEAVKARKAAAAGEVDEANPAGIDATTLASGTYPGLPVTK